MVAERDGLGHLQVGEARHDGGGVLQRDRGQRVAQLAQQVDQGVDFVAQPQADVGGDLVVARAAGVQALAGVAHELHQALLDVQVHVFQVQQPLERAGVDLREDLLHAALDVGQVLGRDDALRGQHVGVRQRAADVVARHALVEIDRGRVAFDEVGNGFRETGGPRLRLVGELVLAGVGSICHDAGNYIGPARAAAAPRNGAPADLSDNLHHGAFRRMQCCRRNWRTWSPRWTTMCRTRHGARRWSASACWC
ncbi:Uncharacterised protein [Bordetella pertussis]|nr:Uncharacterised protein [Bordetella pertussis]CFO03107.1 Uncharacterised protein [Bordetella pertussis]CFO31843.1 Uncharacterised protein [Bordetella pertussis]CFO68147.1 Uncharacterised protein [Bordetella pertussis]CFO77076.1 Uncharacterised protein [Bordetella pertussis]